MNNFPPVTKWLLISNIVIFALQEFTKNSGVDLVGTFGLHFFLADNFQLHQLFTYMFLHANLSHLFFNMFALWMFGRLIESTLGVKHFLIYYLICGIGAGFCQEIFQYGEYCVEGLANFERVRTPDGIYPMGEFLNYWRTVGASGAVYAILMAFGMMFPNQELFIFPLPMPIKAKWLIIGYFVIELGLGIMNNDGIAHFAHLGGMVFGFLLIVYWRMRGTRNERIY